MGAGKWLARRRYARQDAAPLGARPAIRGQLVTLVGPQDPLGYCMGRLRSQSGRAGLKYAVLAVLLFLTGVGLTRIQPEQRTFTPFVRLRTIDGMFMTFVQAPFDKRTEC